MFNIDKRKYNKIMLTRGDTASMLVEIYDIAGNKYEIQPLDVITFTMRKPNSEVYLSKDATPDHYIVFAPGDTAGLDCGIYQYDVQLTTENGSIYTVVPPAIFELTEEITR